MKDDSRPGTPVAAAAQVFGRAGARATSLGRTMRRLALREGSRLARRARKYLGSLYYRHLYDRPYPLVAASGQLVRAWERRDRRGDVPQDQVVWEQQYAQGRWDYMAGPHELVRYNAVIELLLAHAPGGAVLDVGCGEGILFQRYRTRGYSRYVGVDISATAIARLAAEEDARTSFVCADADSYIPAGPFDAIVFNESLYYLQQPFATVQRYLAALAPAGVLIVSTYTASPRAVAIREGLKRRLSLRQEVRISRGDATYLCDVFGR